MTPEAKVKDALDDFLKSLGNNCWFYKPVPFGYGKRGVPDYLICYKGRFISVETKRRKGKARVWQERQMQEIVQAFGIAFTIDSDERIAAFRQWLFTNLGEPVNAL